MTIETAGAVTASSSGTVVTSGSGGNYNATYTELIASTSQDWYGFYIGCAFQSNTGAYKAKIAVGAAASEVDIFEWILEGQSVRGIGQVVFVPLKIPVGSRVSANLGFSNSTTVELVLYGIEDLSDQTPIYTTATTHCLDIACDAGATANTKVRTELVASTGAPIDAISVFTGDTVTGADTRLLCDIETGAAASEVVVLGNLVWRTEQTGGPTTSPTHYGPMRISTIASGARLSCNIQADTTNVSGRVIGITVVGFDTIINPGTGAIIFAVAHSQAVPRAAYW
jgi:hypothetical protein